MKKTMWKWKAVLTLMVCMAAVGGNGSGCKVQAETEGDFEYYDTEDGDGVVITGRTGKGGDVTIEGDVTIPETIGGKKVTSIGDGAFSDTPWIETKKEEAKEQNSLVIINNILIDGRAAKGDIEIPANVIRIGDNAFYSCNGLTSITGMSGVESIGVSAFEDCSRLKSIDIPDSGLRRPDYYCYGRFRGSGIRKLIWNYGRFETGCPRRHHAG